jgi:hypothetical protein
MQRNLIAVSERQGLRDRSWFAGMVAQRMTWEPGYHGFNAIRDEIVKLGPELRHYVRLLLGDLRKLTERRF